MESTLNGSRPQPTGCSSREQYVLSRWNATENRLGAFPLRGARLGWQRGDDLMGRCPDVQPRPSSRAPLMPRGAVKRLAVR